MYWFWHSLPSPDEIRTQLRSIKDAGYGTVFIQARLAFPIDKYLGPEYLAASGRALEVMRGLGLVAGLYDDYNWISGHAGGRTVAADPDLKERHLFWATAEPGQNQLSISGIRSILAEDLGPACADWLYEGGGPQWSDWRLESAVAARAAGDPAQPMGRVLTVTDNWRISSADAQSCRLSFQKPADLADDMRVTAFVSARCATSRLINYLHPRCGEGFIKAGYEPYRDALSRYFGDPLKLIFFDQPYSGFYDWRERTGNVLNSLMFHESLREIFEKQRGYPLSHALASLVDSGSADSPRLRCDFFETYSRLAGNNFLGPLKDWAHENGLALSGHELLSFVGRWGFAGGLADMDSRVNFGADYFAVDEYKDISAVDACNYHPQLSARFGASLAGSHGRRGCLVEQYTVADGQCPAAGRWDLTLDELRAQSIRHVLQGAFQVVFHGFYQSDGRADDPTPLANPRLDFAPGINFEPWFDHHLQYAFELTNLARFLAGADEFIPVSVLYPLRTFRHAGAEHPFNRESAWWHKWLSDHNLPFRIIDEGMPLSAGEMLVLPGVEVVADDAFAGRLERFLKNGGLVVASGPLPRASQAKGADPELAARVKAMFTDSENALHFDSMSVSEDCGHKVAEWIKEKLRLPVSFKHPGKEDGSLWSWAGEEPDGWRTALFNQGCGNMRVEIKARGEGLVPFIHPMDGGTAKEWAWCEAGDEAIRVWVDIAPNELACFRFRKVDENPKPKPRLISVKGRAGRCGAVITPGGGFEARCVMPEKSGALFTLESVDPPKASVSAGKASAAAPGEARWQVAVETGSLPEPLELAAGWVFGKSGDETSRPIDPRRGWEALEPCFSGIGIYEAEFDLPASWREYSWELVLPRAAAAVKCALNGSLIGQRGWPPFRFAMPENMLNKRANRLWLEVAGTAENRYRAGAPCVSGRGSGSGLLAVPVIKPVAQVFLTA